MRIAVVGCTGRIGRLLLETISMKSDYTLVCAVSSRMNPDIGVDAFSFCGKVSNVNISDTLSNEPFVVVDFSTPSSTMESLDYCVKHNVPLVIGTTGFTEEQLIVINEYSKSIPIFMATNFSISVYKFTLLAKYAASLYASSDIEITEIHHRDKKDAPSGTALTLASEVSSVLHGRTITKNRTTGYKTDTIGISSLRGGDIVGKHVISFFGIGDNIELSHNTTSRQSYIDGALSAASFIVSSKPGLYSMCDLI